jgi:hypothetical protein
MSRPVSIDKKFADILLAMHRRVSTRRIELNLSIDPLVASIVIDFDAGGR